jgi:hypothetical protein
MNEESANRESKEHVTADGEVVVRFDSWLRDCLACDRPKFVLKKSEAASMNATAISDDAVRDLATDFARHKQGLAAMSNCTLSFLRHHRHRLLCTNACRVLRRAIGDVPAMAGVASLLSSTEIDAQGLAQAAHSAAIQLGTAHGDHPASDTSPDAHPVANDSGKPKRAGFARQHILTIALGLAVMQRQLDSDKAAKAFLDALTPSAGARRPTGVPLLIDILRSQDRTARSVAAVFALEIESFDAEARRARHESSELRQQAMHFEDQLRAREVECAELQNRLRARDTELHQLRQQSIDEQRLALDHEETVRARVSKRLRSDVAMLEEGLDALRRDPPRVRVMEDHADRVRESLRKELEQLEPRGHA